MMRFLLTRLFSRLHAKGSQPFFITVYLLTVLFSLSICGVTTALAATFTVTSLADTDGGVCNADCTLRQAINAAQYATGEDTIEFGVAGTVRLSRNLPNLYGPVTIRNAQREGVAISGDVNGDGVASDGDVHIFLVLGNEQVTIENLTLRDGFDSEYDGALAGGIYNNGNALLINCTLTRNRAEQGGGAIYNNGGTLSLLNCTFALNSTAGNGGAIYTDGNFTAIGCTFSGNLAGSTGGAIFTYPFIRGRFTLLRNCTLSGNTAGGVGGALNNIGGQTTIENCTITANKALFYGGSGIYASDNYQPTATIVSNSIIVGNIGLDGLSGNDVDLVSQGRNSFISGGYNLIGKGSAAENFDQSGDKRGVSDIKLGPLENNGGTTQTHALLEGSPAINGGDPNFATDAIAFDQRGTGFLRVRAGRLDIGAFEFQTDVAPSPSVTAIDDSYDLLLAPSQNPGSGVTLQTNGIFRIDAPGVLANDSDSQNSALTTILETNPQHGRIQLRTDGTIFYLPSAGFAGTDDFTYRVSNGFNSTVARVRLNLIDRLAPELRFDTPINGATVESITKIAGRVRDRNAGIQSLTLLWRRSDGTFWNGTYWTAIVTELPLTMRGINWTYEGKLPTTGTNNVRDLLDGVYNLRVTAIDKSSNTTVITNRVTVKNQTTPTPEVSDVRLSSATASVAQKQLGLKFTGALDVASVDKASYKLLINGVATPLREIYYYNQTLVFASLDFDSGDKITLQIANLRDASGKTIAGGTIQLTAR